MNKKMNKVAACIISALVATGTAVMPIMPVTAYAPKPGTVFVAAEGISVSKSEITIGKGESYSLTSTVTPSSASNKSVLWQTSNPNVVYVDGNGKITAKSVGTATVSVITHNGKKALCYVKVQEAPSKITLNCHNLELGEGESYRFYATVPENTAACVRNYTSSNNSVVSFDSKGNMIAKKTGTATITVKVFNGVTDTCKVTVKKAPSSVTLNKHEIYLGCGEKFQFHASVPENTASCIRTYTSSNNDIVSCDSRGNITAKKTGTAIITVKTFNGKTDTCKVCVMKTPEYVTVEQDYAELYTGDTFKIITHVSSGATSYVRTFSSNYPNIASVDSRGLVTAKNSGTAVITVKTFNGKTTTCKINVIKAPEYITVDQSNAQLYIGDTFQIKYALSAGSYSKTISYSSSNTNVAAVDSKGLITAKNSGSAKITVTTSNGKTAVVNVSVTKLAEINEWSSDDDILNSVRLNPVKTNSKLLDDKIDSIFSRILTPNMSNADKVRACYDYLATNISYDYISYDYSAVNANYVSSNDKAIVVSAYSTLVKYRGNCYDYACTLAAVMKRLGYDAHVVHGLVGMRAGGYGNHYWVDVNINSKHYIFDAQVENNNLGWGGTVNHYFYCLRPENTSMYIYQEVWSTENFKVY